MRVPNGTRAPGQWGASLGNTAFCLNIGGLRPAPREGIGSTAQSHLRKLAGDVAADVASGIFRRRLQPLLGPEPRGNDESAPLGEIIVHPARMRQAVIMDDTCSGSLSCPCVSPDEISVTKTAD
jgi:hypothetical protein